MPIHITMDKALEFCAHQVLQYQDPNITEERERQIKSATKYNLLIYTFNTATVLVAMAVISAAFLAFSAAVTFGSMGLFIRFAAERQIEIYAAPKERDWNVAKVAYHLLHNIKEAREARIFANFGLPLIEDWNEDEVFLFDFAIWKNTLPIP